jgi:excisionase family DNA binding protein
MPNQNLAELFPGHRTPEELAEAANKSPRTVRRWIRDRGLKVHRFGNLHLIADADFRDLVLNDGQMPPARRPGRPRKTP